MPLRIKIGEGNVRGAATLNDYRKWGQRIDAQAALVKAMGVDLMLHVEMRSENDAFKTYLDRLNGVDGNLWGVFEGKNYKNSNTHLYYKKSKFSLLKTEYLKTNYRYFTRWLLTDTATGLTFYVVGCHFKHRDPKERVREANLLVKWLKDLDRPVVILGDFNSGSKSKGYPRDILKKAGFWGMRDRNADIANRTYRSYTPTNKKDSFWIDEIFTKTSSKVVSGGLVLTNGASDHNWLRADIDLDPEAVPIVTPEPVIPVERASYSSPIADPFPGGPVPFREAPSGFQPLSVEVWRTVSPYAPDVDEDDDEPGAVGPPTYERRGVVAAPSAVNGSIVANGAGSLTFTLDSDHPRVGDLVDPGARAVVLYRYAPGSPARPILSGTVEEVVGQGPTVSATRTFTVRDDWAILNEILGLPAPTKGLEEQGDDETGFFAVEGDAETVLKAVVAPNAARQGVELTVPTSLQRGAHASVTLRMHPLADRLFPAISEAGLLVRVLQVGAKRYLLASEPVSRPRVLTEASGVVLSGEFTIRPPKVTRVIVGSGGEGAARLFREYVDEDLESDFGLRRATFVDANDVAAADVTLDEALQKRADEALAAGSPTVSVKVALSETEEFRFGKAYDLGDFVSLRLSGSDVDLADQIREIRFDYDTDQGLLITPLVGEWQDSPNAELYRAVSVLARSARNVARR